jgi:hypothetical protein
VGDFAFGLVGTCAVVAETGVSNDYLPPSVFKRILCELSIKYHKTLNINELNIPNLKDLESLCNFQIENQPIIWVKIQFSDSVYKVVIFSSFALI